MPEFGHFNLLQEVLARGTLVLEIPQELQWRRTNVPTRLPFFKVPAPGKRQMRKIEISCNFSHTSTWSCWKGLIYKSCRSWTPHDVHFPYREGTRGGVWKPPPDLEVSSLALIAPLLFLSSWGQRLRQGSPGAQAGVEFLLFLLPALKCWDYTGPGTAFLVEIFSNLRETHIKYSGSGQVRVARLLPAGLLCQLPLSSRARYQAVPRCILYILHTLLLIFNIKKRRRRK